MIFQLKYLYLGLKVWVDFFIKWKLMQLGVLLISKLLVWRTWNPKCLPAQWMHALATQLTVISWGALHSNGKSIIWFSLGLFLRSLNLNRLYPLNQFCKQNFFGKILLEGVFLVNCGSSCIDLWALREEIYIQKEPIGVHSTYVQYYHCLIHGKLPYSRHY